MSNHRSGVVSPQIKTRSAKIRAYLNSHPKGSPVYKISKGTGYSPTQIHNALVSVYLAPSILRLANIGKFSVYVLKQSRPVYEVNDSILLAFYKRMVPRCKPWEC